MSDKLQISLALNWFLPDNLYDNEVCEMPIRFDTSASVNLFFLIRPVISFKFICTPIVITPFEKFFELVGRV